MNNVAADFPPPVETHFHQALSNLKLRVLEMGVLSERAVEDAVSALRTRDANLAQRVIEDDQEINALQAEVDEKSLTMLALGQPKARDLRFIVGSIHVVANLERAADQAVVIAERAVLFSQRPEIPPFPLFDNLAEQVLEMLAKAVKAYNTNDTELALAVCRQDIEVDSLALKLLKHYIDNSVNDSSAVERSVHMIILSRALERIGDLSTNVAEHVLCIVKGVNLKASCHRI